MNDFADMPDQDEKESLAAEYVHYIETQFPGQDNTQDSFFAALADYEKLQKAPKPIKESRADIEIQLWNRAAVACTHPAKLIVAENLDESLSDPKWWAQPSETGEQSSFVSNLNLLGSADTVLSRMARAIAAEVLFPVNTAYLHGLGVIASLAVRRFKVAYWSANSTIPVNLYVVTSQPSSSGKSGVNNAYSEHARKLIADENKKNRVFRNTLTMQIKKLAAEIEKGNMGSSETEYKMKELEDLEEKLVEVNPYRYGLNDATPEKAEMICAMQGGVFTIVSAESFGVKSILGDLYGNGTPNQNLFLSAWDGEFVSSARVTREGYEGYACASIAVLAQDSTFDSILSTAGKDSCGVSERFLMGREPDMAGNRKSKDRIEMPRDVRRDYEKLVENILAQPQTTLRLTRESLSQICIIKDFYDDLCAPGQRYSNDVMKGIVGKADKQIHKLASVLHIVDHWKEGGDKSVDVDRDTVFRAFNIFKECVKIYEAIADNRGVVGKNTSMTATIDKIKKIIRDPKQSRTKITIAKLRDDLKGLKELKRDNFTKFLRESLIPDLEKLNIIVHDQNDDFIYINPRLRD